MDGEVNFSSAAGEAMKERVSALKFALWVGN